jgi:hypothetical protein
MFYSASKLATRNALRRIVWKEGYHPNNIPCLYTVWRFSGVDHSIVYNKENDTYNIRIADYIYADRYTYFDLKYNQLIDVIHHYHTGVSNRDDLVVFPAGLRCGHNESNPKPENE